MSAPDISVTRARGGTEAEIKTNPIPSAYDTLCIYRADDYRANFYVLARIGTNTMVDENLDTTKNYKYKASFGLQSGIGVLSLFNQPLSSSNLVLSDGSITEGQRSKSIYTIGE